MRRLLIMVLAIGLVPGLIGCNDDNSEWNAEITHENDSEFSTGGGFSGTYSSNGNKAEYPLPADTSWRVENFNGSGGSLMLFEDGTYLLTGDGLEAAELPAGEGFWSALSPNEWILDGRYLQVRHESDNHLRLESLDGLLSELFRNF